MPTATEEYIEAREGILTISRYGLVISVESRTATRAYWETLTETQIAALKERLRGEDHYQEWEVVLSPSLGN
jgi:hypothetical protein